LSQDDNAEIKAIIGHGVHEAMDLVEKSGKNPFILEETFTNILKSTQLEV